MGEETTIMGTVLSVVFQNEENGYACLLYTSRCV